MADLTVLDTAFSDFIENLDNHLPDGVLEIDLFTLQQFNLLDINPDKPMEEGQSVTRYFHVVESSEKITLFNERFAVWIVPQVIERRSHTFCLIALREPRGPELEMVFSTSGVYNSSKLVLKILERILADIQETEQALDDLLPPL